MDAVRPLEDELAEALGIISRLSARVEELEVIRRAQIDHMGDLADKLTDARAEIHQLRRELGRES